MLIASTANSPVKWREIRYGSADGLSLFARDYGPVDSALCPVICLSGLTRNSKEFHAIASDLASDRRVVCPDYRGRGQSDYAADWSTYQLPNEMADIVALMDFLNIPKAFFIGTSRGGLIAMLMATMFKTRIAGVVLNDVGPVIEIAGLSRIASYVGKPVTAATWNQATGLLKKTNPGFDLNDDEWLAFAQTIFKEQDGAPALDYDPNLANTLPPRDTLLNTPLPDMWPMFSALNGLPVAAIRGENSDLLSTTTLKEMQNHHAGLHAETIPGRGHTPFLTELSAMAAIRRTLQLVD